MVKRTTLRTPTGPQRPLQPGCLPDRSAGASAPVTSSASWNRPMHGSSPGEVGSLFRRGGMYSSQLAQWRKQRERGSLYGSTQAGKVLLAKDEKISWLRKELNSVPASAGEGRSRHSGPRKGRPANPRFRTQRLPVPGSMSPSRYTISEANWSHFVGAYHYLGALGSELHVRSAVGPQRYCINSTISEG